MENGLGNKKIMARNIKYYLYKLDIPASKVCADLNIPKATFSNWCNARIYPRIDKIEMLANYFGCQKADLVEDREKGMASALKKELDEKQSALIELCNSLTTEEQRMAVVMINALIAQREDKEEK